MKPPVEIIPATSSKSITRLITGILICLFLTNALCMILLNYRQPNQGYWLIKQKWQWLLHSQETVHTLFLGDSSCNQGLIPSVYSNVTGNTAYNLGTIGDMSLVNDAWMLDTYLKTRTTPPKTVVVMHTFDSWNRPYMLSCLAQIPANVASLYPPLQIDFAARAELRLTRYVPLYYQNYSIKECCLAPVRMLRRTYSTTNGFFAVSNPNRTLLQESFSSHMLELEREIPFAFQPYQETALLHIATLAEKHHFTVVIVPAPLYSKLAYNPLLQAYMNQITDKLHDLFAKHPRIKIYSDIPAYTEDVMESDDHLTYAGAVDFTTQLATRLSRGN